ncbi:MAG TPA: LytR C-terminal domain-containing protein [Gaiellaceae bacterium]|jgi:transcriptional regulator with XRE-family HTH domain|nr:LytR C-terminal domain-containing protein [Gaiellaceae bacterium]
MNALVEAAALEQQHTEPSPLARARVQRQLTVEQAAKRAGLTPEEVGWIEDGRLYRFGPSEKATLALLLYATALDISRREARRLAGLPLLESTSSNRLAVLVGMVATALAVAAVFTLPEVLRSAGGNDAVATQNLPAPWKISVVVLNGGGDINYTRRVADRIGSMAYQIKRVARANRFDYPETAVYFPPGGEAIGQRLAKQLGVAARPLPAGKNSRRLVVIAGPPRALG